MQDFPPDSEDVVVVASRLVGDDRRAFEFDGEPPEEAGDLPELGGLRHENELVEAMKERGWRVTMVGGGAGSGDLRRFYFRRK